MNEAIVSGNAEEQNTKPEQQTLRNLRDDGLGLFRYHPRCSGRTAQLAVCPDTSVHKGGFSVIDGYYVTLDMVVHNDEFAVSDATPSVSVYVPRKPYSREKHYWELLLKLDPIAPELCAAFEADPIAGAASFKHRMQELFGGAR